MIKEPRRAYLFGPFRLDPVERLLTRNGEAMPLTGKAFDTLVLLVQNSGRALEKDELLKTLWPDVCVEEGNLTQNISVVRKALDDDPIKPRYIETLPRRGYRFRASVRELEPRSRYNLRTVVLIGVAFTVVALLWGWHARSEPSVRSLAVLPLKPLQNGAESEEFGLGIADGVITRVSRVRSLIVRPISAVRKYASREGDPLVAARELKVDAVLDGTFQRDGDRLRTSLNLLRARDGVSLWAESFDVSWGDFFAVQDQVSRQIVARLRLSLSAAEQNRLARPDTASTEAYEYYLRAMKVLDRRKRSWTKPIFQSAVALLQRAVEIDPNYARARAELGQAYAILALFFDLENPAWLAQAEEQLHRAQNLDPSLAEVHVVRHWILCSGYGGFNVAEATHEMELARRLNPSVPQYLGSLYAHLGLEKQAIQELERALEIDPTSENRTLLLTQGYELLGRTDEAIERYRRFWNQPGPELALVTKGRLDEAEPLIAMSLAQNPNEPYWVGANALILALRGKFADAEAQIEPTKRFRKSPNYHHAAHNFAAVYALQGKAQPAVKWLRETAETGLPSYLLFSRDPNLNRVRKDPAFVQFMAEMKTRWGGYLREFP
jgi:DNA-binding winged helix-turn-helix (wHTH) protein/TolB-like protein/Flp pilus assembly protein TadD